MSAAVPPLPPPSRAVQHVRPPRSDTVEDPTITKRRKVRAVEQIAAAPDDGASHDTTTTVARPRDDVDEDVEEEGGTVSSFVPPSRCHKMKVGEFAIMQVWEDFLLECETIGTPWKCCASTTY